MDEQIETSEQIEETLELAEESAETETSDFQLATVGAVTANGVKLIFDGTEEASDKEYRCNSAIKFSAGDRVKITKDSGTYMVDYAVGAPMAKYPIPSGGSSGQVLGKGSSDYSVQWVSLPETHSIPSGGSTGAVLMKSSNTDYDAAWSSILQVPSGGTAGYVLTKNNNGYGWAAVPKELPSSGTAGQFLSKTSTGTAWSTVPSIPAMSGTTSGQYLTNNGSAASWATPSFAADKLKSGSYTVTLSSQTLTPSASGSIHLGTNTSRFGNLYANGDVKLGSGNSSKLGFFGGDAKAKVTNITTSSTLSALITALKTYNLV